MRAGVQAPVGAAVCLGKAGGGEGAAQLLSGAESRTPTPLKRGTVGERLCCLRPLLLRPRPPTCQPSRALARVPLTLHRIWLLPGGNAGPEGRMAQQRPPEAPWGLCASRPAQLAPAGRRWRRGPASVPSSRVTNSHISVRARSDSERGRTSPGGVVGGCQTPSWAWVGQRPLAGQLGGRCPSAPPRDALRQGSGDRCRTPLGPVTFQRPGGPRPGRSGDAVGPEMPAGGQL